MGFFNPIPTFKSDYGNPYLCLIYKKPRENSETIHIQYFKDSEEINLQI